MDPAGPHEYLHAFLQVPGSTLAIIRKAISLYRNYILYRNPHGDTSLFLAFHHRRDRHAVIRCLLEADPRLGRICSRPGRLPLLDALQAGMSWSQGVKDVFEAEPRAVTARDPDSMLYPFLEAATRMVDLDTIFELLRADPSVLVSATV